MRFWLPFLLLVTPLFIQAQAAQGRDAPSCGLDNVTFAVKTSKGTAPVASPDSGKALVYFLEDDSAFGSIPKPTVRFGMDGQWVGATHGSSWFSFPVEPGEHHLCADWQRRVVLPGPKHEVAAVHFIAKPGKSYFFRMQNSWDRDAGLAVNFAPLDGDEGQILIRKFAFSTSQPKK
jgi:hypothetical protein